MASEGARGLWEELTSPPPGQAIGQPVFEAWGLTVGGNLYRPGFEEFLDGRARTPELEREYRRWLNERLLAMRWLENNELLTDAEFRGRLRLAMMNAISTEVYRSVVRAEPVTDAQVRALYGERLPGLTLPEMVRARIILVPTEEEARRVMERLRAGELFGDVAAVESRHESKSRGGEVDPFARGTYNAELEEKAFAMTPGETDYVTTPAGTFVIEKVSHQRLSMPAYDDVAAELRAELESRAEASALREAVERLRREVSAAGNGLPAAP